MSGWGKGWRSYKAPQPKIEPKIVSIHDTRMNKWERAYSQLLDLRKFAGEIRGWDFEAITFRLAKKTRYTPDFAVYLPDGTTELHEVKGFWREDARVKIKVAARMFPAFKFIAVRPMKKKHGGGWAVEEFTNDHEQGGVHGTDPSTTNRKGTAGSHPPD